jgi:hypothetical protein
MYFVIAISKHRFNDAEKEHSSVWIPCVQDTFFGIDVCLLRTELINRETNILLQS